MKQFTFPRLNTATIDCFSLYKKAERIEVDLTKNVFCLAGANGLGKSTFITIINYALTGIVKNPDRQFTWYNSVPAFYTKSKSFASEYFKGRVDELNRDLAQVTISFTIDNSYYEITRGFFEPDELRSFKKWTDGEEVEIKNSESTIELNEEYKYHFTNDVRLSEFNQFVFLQSYVFTFDETHQLLFWDSSVLERVLYLFFGLDATKAKQADFLRKEASKYDSNVRNLQWQITKTRNELIKIEKDMQLSDDKASLEIFEHHKSLVQDLSDFQESLSKAESELRETEYQLANISYLVSNLRSDYENVFSNSSNEEFALEKDSEIIDSLRELNIKVISNESYEYIVEKIVNIIKSRNSNKKNNDDWFESLKAIDQKLSEKSSELKKTQVTKDRLIREIEEKRTKVAGINLKLSELEKKNEKIINFYYNKDNDEKLRNLIESYESQIVRYTAQKDDDYIKRGNARKQLELLEVELNDAYLIAESVFIPVFNTYARNFLGLDVNVQINLGTKGTTLSLYVDSSTRRDSYQLSESQRYFIDIALRMALVELSTDSVCMFIDTPEGSLDIAYESRAGRMLADFSKKNYNIVMTANINTSQLLLELAEQCKAKYMKLERMTEWTTLSDVQQQESQKIENAFHRIEEVLNS